MNRRAIFAYILSSIVGIAACGMPEDDNPPSNEEAHVVENDVVENDDVEAVQAALAGLHPIRLATPARAPTPFGEFPVCLSTFIFKERLTFNRCVPGKARMLWRITSTGQITDGRGRCWEAYPDEDDYWDDIYLKKCNAQNRLQRFTYAADRRLLSFTTKNGEKQYVCLDDYPEREHFVPLSQSVYFNVNLNPRSRLVANPQHCRLVLTFP